MAIEFRKAQNKIIDFGIDQWFVKDEPGFACFAKIGSGKTLAGLELFRRMQDFAGAKRALIVAPKRVLSRTWPNEIKEWGYNYRSGKVNGKAPNTTNLDIVFCSPDSLHHVIPLAQQKLFDLLLVDESQRFQNFTSDRIKNMRKIIPFIPKRAIFTATPRANKMNQLFGQMYIVDEGQRLGKNKTVANSRFCTSGGYHGREDVFLKEKEKEVLDLIAPITVYVGEADIDFDYPALITNDLVCEIDEETRRHQHTLKEDLYAALENGETLTVGSAGAAYNSLKQLANGFLYGENKEIKPIHNAKLDALESIANESPGQVLVFYWYQADLERIVKKLGAANCCVPAGKSDKLANKEIDKWMEHKKQFLVCQIQSMGEGLNLQAPDHDTIVMYGVPDSTTIYQQSIGREQRPGGAKHIFLHRIILEDSIEQRMIDRLDGRIASQDEFLTALKDWCKPK